MVAESYRGIEFQLYTTLLGPVYGIYGKSSNFAIIKFLRAHSSKKLYTSFDDFGNIQKMKYSEGLSLT